MTTFVHSPKAEPTTWRIFFIVASAAISTRQTTGPYMVMSRYYGTHGENPSTTHLLTLADGTLYPITPTGAFTLRRLRLNRPPLVAHRLRKHYQGEEQRLLARYQDLVMVLEQLQTQQAVLLEEQQTLLEEQRALLRLLLKQQE